MSEVGIKLDQILEDLHSCFKKFNIPNEKSSLRIVWLCDRTTENLRQTKQKIKNHRRFFSAPWTPLLDQVEIRAKIPLNLYSPGSPKLWLCGSCHLPAVLPLKTDLLPPGSGMRVCWLVSCYLLLLLLLARGEAQQQQQPLDNTCKCIFRVNIRVRLLKGDCLVIFL